MSAGMTAEKTAGNVRHRRESSLAQILPRRRRDGRCFTIRALRCGANSGEQEYGTRWTCRTIDLALSLDTMTYRSAFILLLAMWVSSCSSGWLQPSHLANAGLIERLAKMQLEQYSGQLTRHELNGNTYYLVQATCCDRGGALYDVLGKYVCSPNGGFSGLGDGRCPALRIALIHSHGEVIPNPFYRH